MIGLAYSPTLEDLYVSEWTLIANKNWLARPKVRFNEDLVTTIYSNLESKSFCAESLLILNHLQFLEKCLWPNWKSGSSDSHAMLLFIMIVVKRRRAELNWDLFAKKADFFSELTSKALSFSLDKTSGELSYPVICISEFIGLLFESLQVPICRQSCASLVSIYTWDWIDQPVREVLFQQHPQLKKSFRAMTKRYEAADELQKSKMKTEGYWLTTTLMTLLSYAYQYSSRKDSSAVVQYATSVVENLITILSQLPTRRFTNSVIKCMNFSVAFKLSPLYQAPPNQKLRKLFEIFEKYHKFEIEDFTGTIPSEDEVFELRSAAVLKFQKIALDQFKDKLYILALSNYGYVSNYANLIESLNTLSDDELSKLCKLLLISINHFEDSPFQIPCGRRLLTELILDKLACSTSLDKTFDLFPTARSFNILADLLMNLDLSIECIPAPKLGVQFISVSDLLQRLFELEWLESFYRIMELLLSTAKRLNLQYPSKSTNSRGYSKMAQKLTEGPSIIQVGEPLIGESVPAYVSASISISLDGIPIEDIHAWDLIKQGDIVFLVSLQQGNPRSKSELEKLGIKRVYSAKVTGTSFNNKVSEVQKNVSFQKQGNRHSDRRTIVLNLDPCAYARDKDGICSDVNFIIRGSQSENNFYPILENTKELLDTKFKGLPDWFIDVFLGYGDPMAASYWNHPNKMDWVDMNDTFLDWNHLSTSFNGSAVCLDMRDTETFLPPFALRKVTREITGHPNPQKRLRNNSMNRERLIEEEIVVEVISRPVKDMGPFHTDGRKRNLIHFTGNQIEAIFSATQPGLSVIVGPPGTGKSDVAAQVISNIYHNHPDQRTLIVTHSKEALDRLFERIAALDIDECHLLRLDGDENLQTSEFRLGRAENIRARRATLLDMVKKLAVSVGAQSSPYESCATAESFYKVFVEPVWRGFKVLGFSDVKSLALSFPFTNYFVDAPQPLFNENSHSLEEAVEIADGCFRHIKKLFHEIEEIRPFELLSSSESVYDYLLTREARIIAMTSTYAGVMQQKISNSSFRYNNLIFEEAARFSELESFLPLSLQGNESERLQRVIMIGDHYQSRPIIQSEVLKRHSNLDQSLFQRFISMGVPHIILDSQDQARSQIVQLYSWRYPVTIKNLPRVIEGEEYKTANAGFRHVVQFINVEDFKGKGETEPASGLVQNLGEAEYAVELYMYMRLLGYDSSKITILTPEVGQRELIKNILVYRCSDKVLFGMPHSVSTIDQYQAIQNDYVIVSLVRTKILGGLQDSRRMTAIFSRARLGLYVLGRREILNWSWEAREFLKQFKPFETEDDCLELVVKEMYPTQRRVNELNDEDVVRMISVEHLGEFVREMTQRKLEVLQNLSKAECDRTFLEDTVEDESHNESDAEADFEDDSEIEEDLDEA
ncbi:P-loop containing nucleoside triphosphate hydrolase protein [Lipomyces oligophaga]|uniref:P-loop containing nucleoside triphosphate hydrolase protein n=1 Tax=Lipomyces oligophaga TaxID=45792 RepID=UPI0034CF75E9